MHGGATRRWGEGRLCRDGLPKKWREKWLWEQTLKQGGTDEWGNSRKSLGNFRSKKRKYPEENAKNNIVGVGNWWGGLFSGEGLDEKG